MGGEFTYPKMVPLVLTHSHMITKVPCWGLGFEPRNLQGNELGLPWRWLAMADQYWTEGEPLKAPDRMTVPYMADVANRQAKTVMCRKHTVVPRSAHRMPFHWLKHREAKDCCRLRTPGG